MSPSMVMNPTAVGCSTVQVLALFPLYGRELVHLPHSEQLFFDTTNTRGASVRCARFSRWSALSEV